MDFFLSTANNITTPLQQQLNCQAAKLSGDCCQTSWWWPYFSVLSQVCTHHVKLSNSNYRQHQSSDCNRRQYSRYLCRTLTHWGPVTHIRVGNLTTIGSDNALSPIRRQAIILTNAGLLSIGPLETIFSEILTKMHQKLCIHDNTSENIVCKMAAILTTGRRVNQPRSTNLGLQLQ